MPTAPASGSTVVGRSGRDFEEDLDEDLTEEDTRRAEASPKVRLGLLGEPT